MAYGFNEDKSKAGFIVIEGSSLAPANQSFTYSVSANRLLTDFGITNIFDYVPISVMQKIYRGDADSTRYIETDLIGGGQRACPYVHYSSNGELILCGYNPTSSGINVTVTAVFVKIK